MSFWSVRSMHDQVEWAYGSYQVQRLGSRPTKIVDIRGQIRLHIRRLRNSLSSPSGVVPILTWTTKKLLTKSESQQDPLTMV